MAYGNLQTYNDQTRLLPEIAPGGGYANAQLPQYLQNLKPFDNNYPQQQPVSASPQQQQEQPTGFYQNQGHTSPTDFYQNQGQNTMHLQDLMNKSTQQQFFDPQGNIRYSFAHNHPILTGLLGAGVGAGATLLSGGTGSQAIAGGLLGGFGAATGGLQADKERRANLLQQYYSSNENTNKILKSGQENAQPYYTTGQSTNTINAGKEAGQVPQAYPTVPMGGTVSDAINKDYQQGAFGGAQGRANIDAIDRGALAARTGQPIDSSKIKVPIYSPESSATTIGTGAATAYQNTAENALAGKKFQLEQDKTFSQIIRDKAEIVKTQYEADKLKIETSQLPAELKARLLKAADEHHTAQLQDLDIRSQLEERKTESGRKNTALKLQGQDVGIKQNEFNLKIQQAAETQRNDRLTALQNQLKLLFFSKDSGGVKIPDDVAGKRHYREIMYEINQLSEKKKPEGFAKVGNVEVNSIAAPSLQAVQSEFQQRYGRPIRVISGHRDPEHNAAVGGAKGSNHITGFAVDIDPRDLRLAHPILTANGWKSLGGTYFNPKTGKRQSEANHYNYDRHISSNIQTADHFAKAFA